MVRLFIFITKSEWDDFIYLELEGVQYEAAYHRVMVPIPVHIWEVIRRYEGTDLSWADKTDEEILSHVEQEVDERIQEYEQAESEKQKAWIVFCGSLVFGAADAPRSGQIEQGVHYFHKKREHQQQIRQAIEELKQNNKLG